MDLKGQVGADMSTPLRRSSRPLKRKLTKAESSELESTVSTPLSPKAKQAHVEKIKTASDSSNKEERKVTKESISLEQRTPKLKSVLPARSPRVSNQTEAASSQKTSPSKEKSTVTISDATSLMEVKTIAKTDHIDSQSTSGRKNRNGKAQAFAQASPSKRLLTIHVPPKESDPKTSAEIILVSKTGTHIPLKSSRRGDTTSDATPQKLEQNLSLLKKNSSDGIGQQKPPVVIKSPIKKPGAKNGTVMSPLKSTLAQSKTENVRNKSKEAGIMSLNSHPAADPRPQPVIVESVIPNQPVLTEAIRSQSVVTIKSANQLFQQNVGDVNVTVKLSTPTDLTDGADNGLNLDFVEENVETCATEDCSLKETSPGILKITPKTKLTEEEPLKQVSQSESIAQISRKRVASELLQAAEIAHGMLGGAHGMLGGKSKNAVISTFIDSSSKKQSKKVVVSHEDLTRSLSPQPPATEVPSTDLAATNTEQSEETGQMKTMVDEEKSIDEMFESATAIVKASLIEDEKVKEFLLNQIPLLTGVKAVVSPSSHFLLHGSWFSITRARKCLEQYLSSMPEQIENNSVQQNSNTKLALKAKGKTVKEADSLSMKSDNKDVLSQENISVLTEEPKKPSSYEIGKLEIMEYDDLDSENDDEELSGGRVKGLDRNKLQGSVEVYEDHRSGNRTFLCSMCGYSHLNFQTVQNHIQTNHSQIYPCKYCTCVFKARSELQKHVKDTHNATQSHVCGLCDKRFANKRYLMTHMKRHSGIKNHQCEICGRKFFESHKLKWHMETHKPAAEKQLPYSCSICGRKFYNRSSLSDHQNIHTGARPFECDACEASFSHRIGLKRHLITHSSARPFPCNTCEKTFKTHKQLEIHEVQHTGQSQHCCPECKKVFSTQYSLKRHIASCDRHKKGTFVPGGIFVPDECTVEQSDVVETVPVENEPLEAEDETVFMCGVCDKLFSALEEAADHARTHTSADVQIELEATGEELEGGHFTIASSTSTTATTDGSESQIVLVSCEEEQVENEDETAAKLFNAMTSQEVTLDDTHLVANTLADLSALGQNK